MSAVPAAARDSAAILGGAAIRISAVAAAARDFAAAARAGSCGSAAATTVSQASSAIVRVAVESENLEDSQQFLLGVAQLFLADPSLEVSFELYAQSRKSETAFPFCLPNSIPYSSWAIPLHAFACMCFFVYFFVFLCIFR